MKYKVIETFKNLTIDEVIKHGIEIESDSPKNAFRKYLKIPSHFDDYMIIGNVLDLETNKFYRVCCNEHPFGGEDTEKEL